MPSPFANFVNATLTVPPQGTGVELDATGNWAKTGGEAMPVSLSLRFTAASSQPERGVDSAVVAIAGYLVDPLQFPNWVRLPAEFDCELLDPNGETRTGKLQLDFLPRSAVNSEAITGQKIQGRIRVKDGK